jgi:RHS repeat-associated protein
MGNLIRADDFRPAAEWTDQSRPVRREWKYDSYSRLTKTTYTYTGSNAWTAPFATENTDRTRPQPAPQISYSSRIAEENFTYDWLNNLVSNTDDSNGFYDRSIGTATFGDATKPHRMTAASNRATGSTRQGQLAVGYDDIGQVTAMVVQRDGTCLPTGASCWSRYAYEWDEVGNLTRARRWNLTTAERTTFGTPASVTGTTITHPTRNPEAEMRYQYDGGQRVVKTVVRGDAYATSNGDTAPKYTVYAFSTVELRSAKWVGTGTAADYEATSATTELLLPAGSVMGRVVSNGIMPKTGTTQQHLLLTFADHLGSTTFTIDHSTSELVEYTTYTAYGQTESDYRTSRWDNRREHKRFTGKEEDIEVGLNYHGARYYSPAMKRWMSADPVTIHSAGSDINPWAYGYGNPTSFVDPDGRLPVPVITAIIGAVVNAAVYCVNNGVHLQSGKWWTGFGIAAGSGAIAGFAGWGAGVGMGAALGSSAATVGGASLIGASAGAASGTAGYTTAWASTAAAKAAGSKLSTDGYSLAGLGKAAAIGAVGGAVGGAAGYWTGASKSSSLSGWTGLWGKLVGSAAGTAGGLGMSKWIFKDKVTTESAGLAFATSTVGTLASAAAVHIERQATIQRIQDCMNSESDKNAIIRFTEEQLKSEGVEVGAAKYNPLLNDEAGAETAFGVTRTATGGIEIGPKPFDENNAMLLADTLVHENVHRQQVFSIDPSRRGDSWKDNKPLLYEREIAAHERGQEFVEDFGGNLRSEQNNVKEILSYKLRLQGIGQ